MFKDGSPEKGSWARVPYFLQLRDRTDLRFQGLSWCLSRAWTSLLLCPIRKAFGWFSTLRKLLVVPEISTEATQVGILGQSCPQPTFLGHSFPIVCCFLIYPVTRFIHCYFHLWTSFLFLKALQLFLLFWLYLYLFFLPSDTLLADFKSLVSSPLFPSHVT